MHKHKIGVVVLHYNLLSMTIQSVELLKRQEKSEKYSLHIVIVDNGSLNQSGVELRDRYQDDENVTVILSRENLGFSKGNNLGYVFVRETLNADFIIFMNNDILIEQDDFFDRVLDLYQRDPFAVCGPDIWAKFKKSHQNPHFYEGYTRAGLLRLIKNYNRNIKIFHVLKFSHTFYLAQQLKKIYNRFHSRPQRNTEKSYRQRQENVVLSGAFLIFSRNYIEKFPEGIYPETFMYMEEDILHCLCMHSGLKMVYAPELKVTHLEGMATKVTLGSQVDKSIFEFRWTIDSAKKYLELMDRLEREVQ